MDTFNRANDLMEKIIEEQTPAPTRPILKAAHKYTRDAITHAFDEIRNKLPSDAEFSTAPKRYYEDGRGLVSHQVWVEGEEGILVPTQSGTPPTIGIVCADLVPNGRPSIAKFKPEHPERIKATSPYGVLLGENETGLLRERQVITVPTNREVWAILQSTREEDIPLDEIQRQVLPRINGVYVCLYL